MSSSQNLEKMPSLRLDRKVVEKYDFKIEMDIEILTRPEWVKVYRDPEGNSVDQKDLEALAEELKGQEKKRISIDWEKTGDTIECRKVGAARFSDAEETEQKPIVLLATPEGPIMGIKCSEEGPQGETTLLDPCVVIYDGKGKINLTPIFNVADYLTLSNTAIRSTQIPNEILVALYPGFVMQNRMMKYQLRPITPFVSSPELETADQ